jgi:hypothetical protein
MHTSDGNPNTVIREAARRALVTSLPSCPYRKLVEDVSRRVDLKGVRSLHEPRASWAHNLATFLHIT